MNTFASDLEREFWEPIKDTKLPRRSFRLPKIESHGLARKAVAAGAIGVTALTIAVLPHKDSTPKVNPFISQADGNTDIGPNVPQTPIPLLEMDNNPPKPFIDYVTWGILKKQGWVFYENFEIGRHGEHIEAFADEMQRVQDVYGSNKVLSGIAGAKFDEEAGELDSQTQIMGDTAANPTIPVYQAIFIHAYQA